MVLRIRLVEPRPAGHNVYDFSLLPRLGLPLIGRMLADSGHDVHVFCELLAPVDLQECFDADLVGISTTTSTAPAAYRLADTLAEAGVPVVLGGPHVTFCTDEALEHAPYVVRGEGERTMTELVACLESGRPLHGVAGLSFRSEAGDTVHNVARAKCDQASFEALPAPDLRLVEGHERMVTKPVMTQWGCPFDCEFCSVTAMFSRSVRYRRTDQVVSELKDLEAERVFFHDDNFVVNKARTTKLLQAMCETAMTPAWFAQMRVATALRSLSNPEPDHDFLSLMSRSGCQMVMVGVEAITDEGLATIGKRQNVETIRRAVGAFHDHGIGIHGMFVAGLDTDDVTSAEKTASFARRLGIDTFQLMIETPLPGTRLWSRVADEGRILSDDWSLFDGHHVVMQPAQMTPLDLQLGVLRATRKFYSWGGIIRSGLAGVLSHLPDLAACARPELLRNLPQVAKAALARRWQDVAPLVAEAIPSHVRSRMVSAVWVPALRVYARRQLALFAAEGATQAHIAYLATRA